MSVYSLPVLHRALVAFTALHLGYGPRAQVLARHRVTEADLRRHRADWELLQAQRAARTEETRLANRAQGLP